MPADTPAMSVRIVLWHTDDEPPLMKMVPMVYSHHVALASMDWLASACGGPELITCDIWQLKLASWEVYATKDGNLPVADSPPTILMRVGGVSRCLNFGVEVEMLNQHFSNALPEHPAGGLPRQFLDQTAGAHVIVWTENGLPPVIFHLPIEHDGTVLLTAHGDLRALWTHPSDPEGELVQSTVHVWTPEETEWKPCGVHAPFKPLPAHRTLLIKNFETWCTVEFGDVLTQLDRASRVFAEESQAKMIDELKGRLERETELRRRALLAVDHIGKICRDTVVDQAATGILVPSRGSQSTPGRVKWQDGQGAGGGTAPRQVMSPLEKGMDGRARSTSLEALPGQVDYAGGPQRRARASDVRPVEEGGPKRPVRRAVMMTPRRARP